MRNIIDFNTDWYFNKTNEIPAALPVHWEKIRLPHTWNAIDGQDGGNDYWRGTAMYVKAFSRPELEENGRAIIEFNGAAMAADVYVNGHHLAHHEGGYSTFRVDITDALQEDNLLCVAVDNGENDHVYPQKADFTFYGGLYRGVNLIMVSDSHFELCKDGTPGIKVTPVVKGHSALITVEAWTDGPAKRVRMEVDGRFIDAKVEQGKAEAVFEIENVHLWDGGKRSLSVYSHGGAV